jgi:4-amino-4-deoxy-L-arabinose transferase-like glycosyltransferase
MIRYSTWRGYVADHRFLPLILIFSFVLNIWGNYWGSPKAWHPDEITNRTIKMVSDRTLNPHEFRYGGLHYYILALGAVIPVFVYSRLFDPAPAERDTLARAQWKDRQLVLITPIARAISALMATSVVCFTFVMGNILFSKRVGYLAALLLSVSMSFVAVAHFATVDSPANFWYWLSCLFALFIWKRGDRLCYILAAITAGFAISTKSDRLIILFPLMLSHFLRGEQLQYRKLVLFVVLIPGSYILANPTCFVSFFEFLDGYTREMFFSALRGAPGEKPYLGIVGDMKSGLGLPLFVSSLAGLAYGLYGLASGKNLAAILWLLSTFVPYYLFFGSILFSQAAGVTSWYTPFFFPPLVILAAYGCMEMMNLLPQRYTTAVQAMLAAVLIYSFLNTIALVSQFSNDSRYKAAEWIEQTIPVNATIEMGPRGPVISKEKYRIVESAPDNEFYDFIRMWHENLTQHQLYQRVRQVVLHFEKWVGYHFGTEVRQQPYVTWFDYIAAANQKSQEFANMTRDRVLEPDYIVLIGYLQRQKLSTLTSPTSDYRVVAQFHFTNAFGFQPVFPFVNPKVYVFQRAVLAN